MVSTLRGEEVVDNCYLGVCLQVKQEGVKHNSGTVELASNNSVLANTAKIVQVPAIIMMNKNNEQNIIQTVRAHN